MQSAGERRAGHFFPLMLDESRLQGWLINLLVVFAALLPFSSISQLPGYLIALVFIALVVRTRGQAWMSMPLMTGSVLFFLCTAVFASVLGEDPGYSVGKMRRFVFLLVIWATAYAVATAKPRGQNLLRACVVALLAALCIRAAYDFIRVPVLTEMQVRFLDTGTMTMPQFYLAGLCFVVALVAVKAWSLRYLPVLVSLVFCIGGLLIHFKRGAWISAVVALLVIAAFSRRWNVMACVAGICAIGLLLPAVRDRLADVSKEFDVGRGGRAHMFLEVAPALIKAHPTGMGWQAVKAEDFSRVSSRVESNRDHVHNTVLQIAVELGVAGAVAWIIWMGIVLVLLRRAWRISRDEQRNFDAGMALGCMAAFVGLLCNGLVEYNFGDSEIFRLMLFLMAFPAAMMGVASRPSEPR